MISKVVPKRWILFCQNNGAKILANFIYATVLHDKPSTASQLIQKQILSIQYFMTWGSLILRSYIDSR